MTRFDAMMLTYWLGKLDDPSQRMRRLAGVEACRMLRVDGVVAQLGSEPPPSWPLVDIVPVGGRKGVCVAEVRTSVGGGVVRERVEMAVPLGAGAMEDAVERGRRGLHARLDSWVVGS